jgi:hypothetical protein
MWFCRCGVTSCLLHTGLPVCTATLRHSPGGIPLRANCGSMASMYKLDWCLQYCEMGTSCISSVISVLHVQVLEENAERRLDVLGRNTSLCYWYYAQQPFFSALFCGSFFLIWVLFFFQDLKQCLQIWVISISCLYRWKKRLLHAQFFWLQCFTTEAILVNNCLW